MAESKPVKNVIKRERNAVKALALNKYFNAEANELEIGVDEAGRGPMLGRVYTAAVVLPKDDSFNHSLMKDSKKFHSVKKIREAADYIKANVLYWHVAYSDERVIESVNIRNATHKAMHESIKGVLGKIGETDKHMHLLIDGNDFKPYIILDEELSFKQIPHTCIEGGDNVYTAIAAASILAKVERDLYIEELCAKEPILDERYGLLKNKGYGTKIHMDGIKKYGITTYHRKTFGICSTF
jgi:ribonuclease HII